MRQKLLEIDVTVASSEVHLACIYITYNNTIICLNLVFTVRFHSSMTVTTQSYALHLDTLPSDVARKIIGLGLESIYSARLVSLRFSDQCCGNNYLNETSSGIS